LTIHSCARQLNILTNRATAFDVYSVLIPKDWSVANMNLDTTLYDVVQCSRPVFGGVRAARLLCVLCCVCFVYLSHASCVANVDCVS
jgi:hypothetical protein